MGKCSDPPATGGGVTSPWSNTKHPWHRRREGGTPLSIRRRLLELNESPQPRNIASILNSRREPILMTSNFFRGANKLKRKEYLHSIGTSLRHLHQNGIVRITRNCYFRTYWTTPCPSSWCPPGHLHSFIWTITKWRPAAINWTFGIWHFGI